MPPSNTNNQRTSPLRAKVLDTALQQFSSKGFFNTSIHDIQREADVSMGSIYNHFAGKEAIARALYDDLLAEMGRLVDKAVAEHDATEDQGRAVVAALFDLTESHPDKLSFILNARHREFLVNEPGICQSRPFEKMRDIILSGIDRGEVRKIDPWLAASLAFGPALRMISLRLDGMIPTHLPELLDELWTLTWNGMKV